MIRSPATPISPGFNLPLGSLGLVLACCLGAPLLFEGYQLFQVSLALSYAVALLGLNLLVGLNGQISLGHGAFFALGAYGAAIAIERLGLPYLATLPLAGAGCLALGFLFGLPALRFHGHYLALCTFALAVAVPQMLKAKQLEAWTGGVSGIVLSPPAVPEIPGLDTDRWLYVISAAVFLIALYAAWNLSQGRIGRALLAIKEQPTAAAAMGIDTALYKATTFGISAAFAGVAGALNAILVQFVSPDAFTIILSISLLTGIAIGGLGLVSGAIYGALFIQYVPNLAEQVSKAAPWAIYGLALIAVTLAMPRGIAGLVETARARLRLFKRTGDETAS